MVNRGRKGRWGGMFIFALTMVWVGAGCSTENSQLARAVLWGDADVGDIDRFSSRPIPKGTEVRPLLHYQGSAWDTLDTPLSITENGEKSVVGVDDFLAARHTTAFIVLRGDTLLREKYFNGFEGDSLHTVFSVSKSVLSAALIAALDQSLIGGLDDPLPGYVPELANEPGFSDVTLRNLVTMSSGIRYEEGKTPWSDEAATYYSPDLRRTALSAEVSESPGQHFLYNNYNPLLIGLALERASGTTLSDFLAHSVWGPMGAEADASWSLDRKEDGFEKMESGFNARARDLARFGALFRDHGRVEDRQVLSAERVDAAVSADTVGDPNPEYQHFWWVAPDTETGPHFWAAGRFGQYVYVVPSLNVVFVRLGTEEGDVGWPGFCRLLARRMAGALAASAEPGTRDSLAFEPHGPALG